MMEYLSVSMMSQVLAHVVVCSALELLMMYCHTSHCFVMGLLCGWFYTWIPDQRACGSITRGAKLFALEARVGHPQVSTLSHHAIDSMIQPLIQFACLQFIDAGQPSLRGLQQ